MQYITYDEARNLIQDGDIISVLRNTKKSSLISWVITKVTNSPIYHTAIAVWMKSETGEKRLFAVEAYDAVRRMVPISQYAINDLHVLAIPDNVKFENFSYTLIERVGAAKYSYPKAIYSGFRRVFKLPQFSPTTGEFCSEMAAKLWKLGGLDIDDTELDPAKLEEILTTKYNIKYRCFIKHYE